MGGQGMILWKQKLATISFKVGSFFSILGTSYIICEVLSDKKKRSRTYFRLLLGMSLFELLEGLALFCGPWCTPKSWDRSWWSGTSLGNMTTCKIQAVMAQSASTGSSLYSGILAIYYVLAIRYNVLERVIRHDYEPYMHIATWCLSLGTGIAILFLDLIKPLGNICWIGRTPGNCKQSYQNNGQTTCTQGDNAQLYQLLFYYIWFYSSFIVTAICMISVWIKIRRQENRNRRHSTIFLVNNNLAAATANSTTQSSPPPSPSQRQKRHIIDPRSWTSNNSQEEISETAAVANTSVVANASSGASTLPVVTCTNRDYSQRFAVQGSLYVMAMYLCNMWWTISIIIRSVKGQGNPNITIMSSIFRPWEGLFITLIYLRYVPDIDYNTSHRSLYGLHSPTLSSCVLLLSPFLTT